jgi:hypothetical protein
MTCVIPETADFRFERPQEHCVLLWQQIHLPAPETGMPFGGSEAKKDKLPVVPNPLSSSNQRFRFREETAWQAARQVCGRR